MLCPGLFLAVAVLTNSADLAAALSRQQHGVDFETEGTVLATCTNECCLFVLSTPGGGNVIIRDVSPNPKGGHLEPGNVVSTSGHVEYNEHGVIAVFCTNLFVKAVGQPPGVIDATTECLWSNRYLGQLIRIKGMVRRLVRDEFDPRYVLLTLEQDGNFFHAAYRDNLEHGDGLESLVGAEIAITGPYLVVRTGFRKFLTWQVITYHRNDIEILKPAPQDPFQVPFLADDAPTTASEIQKMGPRKIQGIVIAVMNGREILLKDEHGEPHRIKMRTDVLPPYGDGVEVVGYAETDLYRINLTDAIWRACPTDLSADETTIPVSSSDLLTDGRGNPKINPTYHGKTVRIDGIVLDLTGNGSRPDSMTIKSGNSILPVDIGSVAEVAKSLSAGCTISLAGVCIVEMGTWRSDLMLPHATGISLVVRKPEDVVIVSRPPWWTPAKLMAVGLSLILVLVAVFIWNRLLIRLVSRRSRALLKEQLSLAEAELKIGERTRLAIELHDSLSQNLAAVACQVSATKSAIRVNAEETMDNLNTVERMLLSCRSELRRCLWDLRNDALDEQSMTEVMRKVLAPVLGSAELEVRFHVPRSRFDDSTLHTVICIIRELAANAVVHGQAGRISVVGDLDDGILALSVRENGRGFEPSACKGPAEGHFGLAGIRERVDRLCGTFAMESKPGEGSHAKIRFRLPSNNTED